LDTGRLHFYSTSGTLPDYISEFLIQPGLDYAFPVIQGHTVSLFPIVTPVLITPVYAIWFSLYSLFGIPLYITDIFMWAKIAASIITALSCVFFYLTLKELFKEKIAVITTLVFAFATSTWSVSSQALWQHGMVELLLILMIYIIIRNEKSDSIKNIIFLGLISGLFIFNRPPDSILLIPVFAYVLLYHKKLVPHYLISAIVSGLPFLLYNMMTFGNVFGGYDKNLSLFAMSFDLPMHMAGLLIAPNLGLLIFSPILILSIFGYFQLKKIQNQKLEKILFIFGPVIVFQIVIYGIFGAWASSTAFSYGQRFLTGFIPVLMIYVGIVLNEYLVPGKHDTKRTLVQMGIIILVLMSVVIQAIGVFLYAYNPNQSMNEENVWTIDHNIVVTSYFIGIERIEFIKMYTTPPLPPLFQYRFRNSSAG
jgi:4-amino-4-deoxy-L-arabinose transferase-like glycosyltransferase